MKNRHNGFTLIELIVVISIISLLTALLIPAVGKVINKAKIAGAASDVNRLAVAITTLFTDTARYPAANNISVSNTSANGWNNTANGLLGTNGAYGSNWDGPYLTGVVNDDPFGTPYFYDGGGLVTSEPGAGQTGVFSAGPNLAFQSFNRADLTPQADDIAHYFNQ